VKFLIVSALDDYQFSNSGDAGKADKGMTWQYIMGKSSVCCELVLQVASVFVQEAIFIALCTPTGAVSQK